MNVEIHAFSNTVCMDVLPCRTASAQNPGTGPQGNEPPRAKVSSTTPESLVRPEDYFFLFENAYDATLITDQHGVCLHANQRVTELLGYDRQILIQSPFWQLVSGADAGLMETVRSNLAANRFLRITAWCLRQDGSKVPTEIAVSQFAAGKETFLCFFIRDETARAQAETQLRTIQNAVRNASTGIGVAGPDGILEYANPALAALFGEKDPTLLAGRKLDALLGNAKLAQELIAAVQKGQSALVECPCPAAAEAPPRWIQISAAPNLDAQSQLIGLVLSLVDISDRHRAEQAERVVERDRVMMDSLGAVCHHLGQPATVLLSTLEIIHRMGDSDQKERTELLQMSLEAAENLRKIMRELNDLRHYSAESYPGLTPDRATSIVAFSSHA